MKGDETPQRRGRRETWAAALAGVVLGLVLAVPVARVGSSWANAHTPAGAIIPLGLFPGSRQEPVIALDEEMANVELSLAQEISVPAEVGADALRDVEARLYRHGYRHSTYEEDVRVFWGSCDRLALVNVESTGYRWHIAVAFGLQTRDTDWSADCTKPKGAS